MYIYIYIYLLMDLATASWFSMTESLFTTRTPAGKEYQTLATSLKALIAKNEPQTLAATFPKRGKSNPKTSKDNHGIVLVLLV